MGGPPYDPIVQSLVDQLNANGDYSKLNDAIQQALKYDIRDIAVLGIVDTDSFLVYMNDLATTWVPSERKDGKDIYYELVVFYFVLNQPAMKLLQNPIEPSSFGQPLSYLSQWLVDYASAVGRNLDQESSLTKSSLQTFIDSPNYTMADYIVPRGGWKTFNDFFARNTKPGKRPIDSLCDSTVIVSPADCKFNPGDQTSWPVAADSIVTIKNIPWSILDLLSGSQYADKFGGGVFTHAFLNTYSYHRQHAPVDGKVVEARVIPGQVYLETEVVPVAGGGNKLQPVRRIIGKQNDALSPETVNAPDSPGYQFLQCRGLIVLETKIGYVAVLPIGMAQVSSVIITAEVGVNLRKGEEISYFQFGGSDVIVVFQAQSNVTITAVADQAVKMGNQIGKAQPTK